MLWYVHHLPESLKIPRRKQAVPRWKRVTEGRRPKDRSLKGGSLVSPGLASQRDRFLTAKQGRLLHQRHCSKMPRCRGVGTPSWAGLLTTSLRGLWVSGYLPRAMADPAQGRRPDNRPGGDDSDPGLASRRGSDLGNCHKRKYSQTSVDCIDARRGGSPKTPLCEGQGPENPGVVSLVSSSISAMVNVPCENLPLQHDWLSSNVVKFAILFRRDEFGNPVVPYFSRSWAGLGFATNAQHRIREDIRLWTATPALIQLNWCPSLAWYLR